MTAADARPRRVLYRGGSVYSPADPFATAVLLEGPTVAWVGSDEAADAQVARADGRVDAVVELDGALVTPAFVDTRAHLPAGGSWRAALEAAASVGSGSVHAWTAPGGSDEELRSLASHPGDGPDALPDVLVLRGGAVMTPEEARAAVDALELPDAAVLGLAVVAGDGGQDAAGLLAHVLACTRAGLQAGVLTTGPQGLRDALGAFATAAAELGVPAVAAARHRLEVCSPVDADGVVTAARLGLVVGVRPAAGADADGVSLAALAAAGVPLALGSGAVEGTSPWEAVRAAAFPVDHARAVSARAAFLAATRGGWRAARRDGEGSLVPGAPAAMAVWEPGDLVVQAPDDRFQAWSTDARSGTPGLPDLTPGVPAPRCLRTVVGGRTAFDAGVLAVPGGVA